MAATTFSTTDASQVLTFSADALTISLTKSGGWYNSRSTTSKTGGKVCVAFQYYRNGNNAIGVIAGLANSSASLGNYPGADSSSLGVWDNGGRFLGGSGGSSVGSPHDGDWIVLGFDLDAKTARASLNGGGVSDPCSFSFAGPYYAIGSLDNGDTVPAVLQADFNGSKSPYSTLAGYSWWDGAASTNGTASGAMAAPTATAPAGAASAGSSAPGSIANAASSAPAATAQGAASASSGMAAVTTSALSAAVSGAAVAVGALALAAASPPTATTRGDASISGPIAGASALPPAAAAQAGGGASGAAASAIGTAPSAMAGGNASATGPIASISAAPASASVKGDTAASGTTAVVTASAPAGTATVQLSGNAAGSVPPIGAVAPTATAGGTSTASGTIPPAQATAGTALPSGSAAVGSPAPIAAVSAPAGIAGGDAGAAGAAAGISATPPSAAVLIASPGIAAGATPTVSARPPVARVDVSSCAFASIAGVRCQPLTAMVGAHSVRRAQWLASRPTRRPLMPVRSASVQSSVTGRLPPPDVASPVRLPAASSPSPSEAHTR